MFNISTWNGLDIISFSNFFGQQGKLSHVAIYAYDPDINEPTDYIVTEVPEPASVAMWLTVAIGGAFCSTS